MQVGKEGFPALETNWRFDRTEDPTEFTEFIGRKVYNSEKNEFGEIVAFIPQQPSPGLWHVVYDDADDEDLEQHELHDQLAAPGVQLGSDPVLHVRPAPEIVD